MIIVLGTASSLIGIYRAIISKKLIDTAISSNMNKLFEVLIVFAISILIEVVIKSGASIITSKCSIEISNGIQKNLYSRIMKTKWLEFSKYHSGDVLTRMTSDVDAVSNMLTNTVPTIISLGVMLVGSFTTFLFMEPHMALILITLSPISILLSRLYSSKLKKLYLKSQELESEYRSFLNESIQNMLIVKTFCLENENMNKVKNIQKKRYKLAISRIKLSVVSNYILSSGYWIGYFVVFCLGALKITKGTITFGTLTAMLQLIGNIQGPFAGLASLLPQVISAIGSTERLMELESLKTDPDVLGFQDVKSTGIIFKNVNFGYKKDALIISNVSVSIDPGETVALIGPSGKGKTTFIHLLLGLIDPEKGHLYITNNSENIEVSANTRKLMSYVPQGNTLFSGTIADNLRFGNPNASDRELESAARAACAWNFIRSSPEGLNTMLGERGTGLSEGQAQRIAIARALLRKVPLLILDEATSALDTKTEIEVLETIKNLNPAPTCIIITHRNTALKICDRVFKLEDNHVIEQNNLNYKDIAVDVI